MRHVFDVLLLHSFSTRDRIIFGTQGSRKNTCLEQYWASIHAWPSCLPSELGRLPITMFPTNETAVQRVMPMDFCNCMDVVTVSARRWMSLSMVWPSPLDGSVSVILVVEYASLVLQDDILLPPCPVAAEELLLSPCRQKLSYPGHAPIWLLPQQPRACPSSWSLVPSSCVCAPEEVSARTRKHAICRRPPSPMYPQSN